jgi:hypothetical protein
MNFEKIVLLISFDGFRHDYLKMYDNNGEKFPTINKLIIEG